MKGPYSEYKAFAQPPLTDLKRGLVRGSFVIALAQGSKFLILTATTMVLARLLSPQDFGLQGMIVVVTGFLSLFQDVGLATATIQKSEVTHEQTSTLFWLNTGVGVVLAIICGALAPLLVAFFHEPRLYWVAVVSGLAFVFNGLSAQHGALLRRGMRFATQAKIGVLSVAVASATGIVMALLGCRYWSLVGMTLVGSIVIAAGTWLAVPWKPGLPRRNCGTLSMLHFGGLATCNNLLVFLIWNADKFFIGRFWGADALGLYGRAYQLVTLPVQELNASVGGAALPALSRFQHDAERVAKSFLSIYALLTSITIPVTITCALFAGEIVHLVLGAQWMAAAPIFRLLAPVSLVFAVANPFSLLVLCTGRVRRSLGISMAATPLVILGVLLGLSHGPTGVALGYSSALTILLIPIASWSTFGTGITWPDLWEATKPAFLSGLLAGAIGLVVKLVLDGRLEPIPYLLIGLGLVLGIYAWMLLFVMNRRHIFLDLISHLLPQSQPPPQKDFESPANQHEYHQSRPSRLLEPLVVGNRNIIGHYDD